MNPRVPVSQQSRYFEVLEHTQARRSTMTRSALTRSAVVGAMLVLPLAACSHNDEAIFATGDSRVVTTATAADTAATDEATDSTTSVPVDTTVTTLDGSSTTTGSSDANGAAAAFPADADVVIDFTYEASDDRRVLNPYIAVWIEDADGQLVKTVSLWYEQSGKGGKYLSHLQRWSSASGETADDSVSGATRVPGSYTVAWDGTDDDGNVVAQGDYVINIEASREHGPYELVSETVSITDAGFSIELTPNGELIAASATLSV